VTILFAESEVPFLSTEQMITVDRLMIDLYGIDLVRMMENAGRSLARLARERFLEGDARGRKVAVLAGSGGNGGGALVCARHLHNQGAQVRVMVTRRDRHMSEVAAEQLRILEHMGVEVVGPEGLAHAYEPSGDGGSIAVSGPAGTAVSRPDRQPDLIVDGVIGYSLKGEPRGVAADLIRWANGAGAPVLSLDVPSGLDAASGTAFEPAVLADATMTLALPKEGLRSPGARALVGELYLADISVPPELYAHQDLGLDVGHVFARDSIVRLW